jgi:hypothetical protein
VFSAVKGKTAEVAKKVLELYELGLEIKHLRRELKDTRMLHGDAFVLSQEIKTF